MDTRYEKLQDALLDGDEEALLQEVDALLDAGERPVSIIAEGMMGAMEIVGERFGAGELFLPEVMMCANAMNGAVEVLRPRMEGETVASRGRVAIGTVRGDLHDIGKNLVAMFLEANGFAVEDLGVDVPAERFLQAAAEGARVVAMSALLTTTMPVMGEVIGALEREGIRDRVVVLVGGAPLSQSYADQIGADGYAPDAAGAASLCRTLVSRDPPGE